MAIGGLGNSESSTESKVVTVRNDVTATDSNVFANRNAGNTKVSGRGTLQIVTNTGLGAQQVADIFAPLREGLLANANQAPARVQDAVADAVVDKVESNQADSKAQGFVAQKNLIFLVVGAVALLAAVAFFIRRKTK